MSPQEQRFDGLFGLAGGQGVICPAAGQDQGGLVVSMCLVAAHDAAEGLLIRPIGSGDKVAAWALLGTVCRIDRVGSSPSLRCCPAQLVWNMAELGRIQVGVHGARMKAHGGHREIFVDETRLWMRIEHLVNGSIDLLTHVSAEPLPCGAAGRGEALSGHPLFLKTGTQLGFIAALVPISSVFAGQGSVERPVALARRSGDEIGNTHIHPNHRGTRLRLQRHLLIEGEGQPPDPLALVQRGRGIERFACQDLFVIGSQFDRHPQWVAFV